MSEIQYNFLANATSLDDIHSNLNAITAVQDDIKSIFGTLAMSYEGEGAAALQQAQIRVGEMLDEALNNTANTQKQAQEQQEIMQDLDRANAAAF